MQIDNTKEKELAIIEENISTMESKANALEITDENSYKEAIDFGKQVKDYGSNITKLKKAITDPANEILKTARAMFKPVEDKYNKSLDLVKVKCLDYKKKIDEKAREEEQKIANRVEKGTMKMETAEKKMAEINRVEKTTQGNIGRAQSRILKKVRIIEGRENDIPREYLVPDMVKIRKDALDGKDIPGVEVYNEEIISI